MVKLISPFESKTRTSDIATVIVTFNRKLLLRKCIDLLIKQTMSTDILIVDNASTDGTEDNLISSGLLNNEKIHYIKLDENTGGAGGFHYGLKYAFDKGWNWYWIMDDDAEPHQDALEKLVALSNDRNSIYGSVAVADQNGTLTLCFPVKKISHEKISFVEEHNLLNSKELVVWLPFLGLFIHRDILIKVGLPDRTLFIRNDDVEYAERAKKHGIDIFMIKESIIEHPYQPTIRFSFLGRKIYYRSMPPWKMYYEVRNKIIIAKRYYSVLSGIKSISGVTLQVLLSILLEKNKIGFCSAYFKGIIDGTGTK
jgi:rhamnopyranosyl-N-acetylglucosaminyl-diphospho-decaprenol beta-1,3/1,4-galactofuranosyltransferase